MLLSELTKRIRMIADFGAILPYEKRDDWQKSADGWRVRLSYQGRQMTLDFWTGSGLRGELPTAEGVLSCLISDASLAGEGFEDFCSNCGYDEDSRKALATFQQCERQTKRLRRLLGDDFEKFMEAENDI